MWRGQDKDSSHCVPSPRSGGWGVGEGGRGGEEGGGYILLWMDSAKVKGVAWSGQREQSVCVQPSRWWGGGGRGRGLHPAVDEHSRGDMCGVVRAEQRAVPLCPALRVVGGGGYILQWMDKSGERCGVVRTKQTADPQGGVLTIWPPRQSQCWTFCHGSCDPCCCCFMLVLLMCSYFCLISS